MTPEDGVTERLKSHLQDGEQILWRAAPLPGIRNLRIRALKTLLGFGLLAWGIALLGALVYHARLEGLSSIAALYLLFGVASMAGGLHYVCFRWRLAARAHQTTRYVLTNRCAYVIVGAGFGSVKSYEIRPDTAIELDRYERHSDVWLHVRYKHASKATFTMERVGFEGIPDGEMAFMQLRSIQAGVA